MKQENISGRRRWFEDDGMELIIWYSGQDIVEGFQILYGKTTDEHALTWKSEDGFVHSQVDQGDDLFSKKSPILIHRGAIPWTRVVEEFSARSSGIEESLREFVLSKLKRGVARGS